MSNWFGQPKSSSARAVQPRAAAAPATVEHLESRRFLSASLKVDNLDVLPGYERLIFNRIRNPNPDIPNYVKERGTIKMSNVGTSTLRFSSVKIEGPFRILGMAPMAIPPGKSVNVTVQFTATAPPPFTYNQTNATTNANQAGAYIGSMTFKTNDPANTTYVEELAGWFQTDSERNQEPNLQTTVNLLANYKTNIAPGRVVTLPQSGTTPTYYGDDEVVSAYWTVANSSRPVSARQLSMYRSQGSVSNFAYFLRSDKVARSVFRAAGSAAQSLLPFKEGQPGQPAAGTFSPGSATFGFKLDTEWSDDGMNNNDRGGGHTVRFYRLRDHFGNILENTYLAAMDYSVDLPSQNWDFQDNVYIISNIKPAGN